MSDQAGQEGSLLLIGYGNTSRRDDGVAEHVLWRLMDRLGIDRNLLCDEVEEEPIEGLGMVCLHQLAPELVELAAEYDTLVFIDAHVEGVGWEPLNWQPVEPVVQPGMVGHHLKPGVIVALCETLYGRRPEAYLLSILGYDFDFGEALSPGTSRLADQAVARLLDLIEAQGLIPARDNQSD